MPTTGEIEAADSVFALMQMQYVPVESRTVKQASRFYDPGSNVSLVRKQFAKEVGWKGRAVLQSLYMTGGQVKAWQTKAYHISLVDRKGKVHKVLAYSIDTITAPTGYVDVRPTLKVFPEVNFHDILRPEGNVDLLLGIQDADLHPILANPTKHRLGKLRLLTSKFGSGYLLDGAHPKIKEAAYGLNPAAKEKTRATFIMRKGSKPPKVSHRTARITVVNFLECEELGTGQPRHCGTCKSCTRCSVRSQEMTKREADELALIEDNIVVDEATNTVWFHYLLIKDSALLTDNRAQTIAVEASVEKKLKKNGQLAAYNDVMKDYIQRGVFKELSQEEMDNWSKPVNYVSHHSVPKPRSTTTALRAVCNSSLDNNNHGVSFNDLLPKGPNT